MEIKVQYGDKVQRQARFELVLLKQWEAILGGCEQEILRDYLQLHQTQRASEFQYDPEKKLCSSIFFIWQLDCETT